MNFNEEKISESLKLIDARKLLIVDWGNFRDEKYAYVCQDFGEGPYKCFVEAKQLFARYNTIHYVQPGDCMHPTITMNYFRKFCQEEGFSFNLLQEINDETTMFTNQTQAPVKRVCDLGEAKITNMEFNPTLPCKSFSDEKIKRGDACFVFRQKELVSIIKICRKNNWKPGRDIGIVAYNDSPLYEIIEDGITTISADFEEMGKKAAEFVTTKQPIKTIIPTVLKLRSSL